jgi:dienelactone hydrolase
MNYRAVAAVASVAIGLEAAACSRPTVETVSVHSGSLTLRALVWQTEHGVEARNRLQLERLDGPDLDDARSGLASLRRRVDVDRNAIALAGHSFGASLTLLMGGREPDLRAIVVLL